MPKLLRQNVGGTDFTMAGCTLTGVCNSAASDYVKSVTLSDGDVLSDGMTVVVAFTNGNTAGTAPASMTIYSSDQVSYFTDSELTQPFTLAPAGCYEIEYTGTGNAYTYISYPVLQIGSVSGPLCDASGNKSSGALWLEGDKVSINYANGCFSVIPQTTGSLTVTTASSVVNGAPIRIGSTVRVLFTQDLAGTANTGLVLTYNGVGIPVMVGKNGSLGAFLPFDVGSGTYKYLQAYTTLEMMFDGTQFIVLGNPVVLSTSDYTIYTDGTKILVSSATQRQLGIDMTDVYTGGYSKKYKIGYCQSSSNAQAFALLQIVGGRVDSARGLRYLSLYNRTNVSGKAVFPSSNNGIYVYNINGRLEVYASLESYVYLQILAFNYRTPRFIFDVQEVSDFPSSDYKVFNNSFTEM